MTLFENSSSQNRQVQFTNYRRTPASLRWFVALNRADSLHLGGVPHSCQNRRKTAVTGGHPQT
jgi:hypothetical protein